MAKTIGSFDLASLKNLRDDVTQYFWFESNSSSAWGSGAHVTLYPESQFTDSTNPNYMKGQNIIMNTDGFSIRNGGLPMMVLDNDSLDFNAVDTSLGTYTTMATFGLTGATIGQSGNAHLELTNSHMKFIGNDGVEYVNIGDSISGTIQQGFRGNDVQTDFLLSYYSSAILSVVVDGVATSAYTVVNDDYGTHVVFETPPPSPDDLYATTNISIDYEIDIEKNKAFTIGTRGVGIDGMQSYVFGTECNAQGKNSFAEGYRTLALADFSHAQGLGSIASERGQTAIGRYGDPYNQHLAFLIGNGTSNNVRSNALTVDWNGNITINNHDSEIGHVYSASKSVAISNTAIDANTDGASISLSAGTYIVIGQWQFDTRTTSGTTNSAIRLYRSGSSNNIAQTRIVAGANDWNCLQCMAIVELTSTETIKVCGATSRPYTTAQGTYINAIRIK